MFKVLASMLLNLLVFLALWWVLQLFVPPFATIAISTLSFLTGMAIITTYVDKDHRA